MDVFDLERKFPELENVTFNGISGWPLLRIIVGYEMERKKFKSNDEKRNGSFKKISNLIRSFYGWTKFVVRQKKIDYIIFSNNLEKRAYNSLFFDRLFHSAINYLDSKNVLLVNYCEGDIEKIKYSYYQNVINGDLLNYVAIIFSRFIKIKISEEDKKLIDKMLQAADVVIDYKNYFKQFVIKTFLYRKLFQKIRPKFIISGCYTYFPQIYSAKLAGIPTIEFQHGLINNNHRGYRTLLNYRREFTCDSLFTFGEQSVLDLDESIYKKEQIRIVGYSYFELLRQGFFDPISIDKRNFDVAICVPIDRVVEKETIKIIISLAQSLKDTFFIINPRSKITEESTNKIKALHNVGLSYEPFQILIQQCSYNLTIYSTCAFESIYFGTPNLLYNFKDYSKRIFGNVLDEKSFSYYFDTEQELVNFIRKDIRIEKSNIISAGEKFYSNRHSFRIKEAFSPFI